MSRTLISDLVFLLSMLCMVLSAPDFCHKLDCPKYTVKETAKSYELRQYEPSSWVATEVTKMELTQEDKRELFKKLLDYISGANDAKMKIAMTAPVLETILHGQGPDCESNFTYHFMVPFSLQNSPPKPTNPAVFLTSMPEMAVYVRSFGGFLNESLALENLGELADDIGDSSKYMQNPYFTAVYDNPYQILNRHNEVWLLQA